MSCWCLAAKNGHSRCSRSQERTALEGEPERCHQISGVLSRKNLDLFVAKEQNLILSKSLVKTGSYFPSKRVKILDDGAADVAGVEAEAERANGGRTILQQVGEELPINYPIELDYDDYLDHFERNLPDDEAREWARLHWLRKQAPEDEDSEAVQVVDFSNLQRHILNCFCSLPNKLHRRP